MLCTLTHALQSDVTNSMSNTVQICLREPVFTGTVRLQSHLLSPLNKSPKETEVGAGFYIISFMSIKSKLQE